MEKQKINKMTNKITLKKDKHIITIYNEALNKTLRYDLKAKSLQKQDLKEKWYNVQHQYEFFKGYKVADIECGEEKFMQLIRLTKKLNPNCISLSTFISRMDGALVYENYIFEGIEFEAHAYIGTWGSVVQQVLTKPLEFYSKPIISFFKDCKIKVTKEVEQKFVNDYVFMERIVSVLNSTDIEDTLKKEIFERTTYYKITEHIKTLTTTYKYDLKSLINYIVNYLIPFENMEFSDAIGLLRDYYSMASAIGRNVKKYPKYLRSMHDIITSNYNSFKKEYAEDLFAKRQIKELECKEKVYCVINPKISKDVISEGTSLNHCVGSYIDKIINGQTNILFLRLAKEPENSLVTLEVIDKELTQAKGAYNRKPTEEEAKFLIKYCKEKELGLKMDLKGGNE